LRRTGQRFARSGDRCASENVPSVPRFPQTELAERIGIIQALVSDYECGKLRLTAEMAIRFAMALEVTTDELLRPNGSKPLRRKPSRRVLRRMEKIQELPPRRQYFVLKALDALLSSSAK
jgi:transcriptional regulator with XRE-family HTH domain